MVELQEAAGKDVGTGTPLGQHHQAHGATPAKGMTRKELLDLFGRAFHSTDTAKGGCPDVHVPPPNRVGEY